MTKRYWRIVGVAKRIFSWTCAKELAYGIIPHGLPLQSFGGPSVRERFEDNLDSGQLRSLEG